MERKRNKRATANKNFSRFILSLLSCFCDNNNTHDGHTRHVTDAHTHTQKNLTHRCSYNQKHTVSTSLAVNTTAQRINTDSIAYIKPSAVEGADHPCMSINVDVRTRKPKQADGIHDIAILCINIIAAAVVAAVHAHKSQGAATGATAPLHRHTPSTT